MKHLLFVILLISCSYRVFTQDTVRVQQNELVELQRAINRHSHKDTIRVHMLTDYANLCFYNLDFLKGFNALSEARIISKQLKFTKGEGLYLKSISIFRRRINAGNAFIKTQDINKVNEIAEVINNLDIYYEVEGNRVLKQYTDFEIFGIIDMPIGIRDSEIETIISKLEEALSYYAEKENVEITAYLQDALSFIYFNSDKEKSKKHKKVAQGLYQELKWSYHQLHILARDIDDLLELGLEAEAKPLEIEAITIYTNEADKYIKAHCAYLLSRVYGIHNRVNLQLEYLFQAEELLTEIGEKDLLKPVYISVAIVYEWLMTNSEKALEYEYKELNLRKEINYNERVAYTYLLISESLLGLKRIQDFPPEYKDYLKVGGVKGSLFFDAELLWVKARMLQAQGKSEEAQSVFQESISAYQKANDPIGGIWPSMNLAESFRGDGDIKNAIKHALIAYEWASKDKLGFLQFRAADILSQLYEQSGEKSKAFDYLKKYRAIKDETEKLNSAARISELEVQSILNKRQREIELLETESQLKEQENKTQRIWLFSIAGALVSLVFLSFILVRNNRQKQKANQVLNSKNKELEIEAALERVRSASMAMHKSEDLINVATVMYDAMKNLGITQSAQCGFVLINEEKKRQELWGSQTDSNLLVHSTLPLIGDQVFLERYEAWKQKQPFFSQKLDAQQLKKHLEVAFPYAERTEEERRGILDMPETTYFHFGNFSHGYLNIIASEPFDKAQTSILVRFAKAFEQTYTRFLDLQKAEAQAKEAQIEVALERVRAATMAMHRSEELAEVVSVLYQQFNQLEITDWGCNIMIFNEHKETIDIWFSGSYEDKISTPLVFPDRKNVQVRKMWEAWKTKTPRTHIPLKGKEKEEYDTWSFSTVFKDVPEQIKKAILSMPEGHFNLVYMKYGLITAFDPNSSLSDANYEVVERFAKVFEQTYTRFLDLQKAEAQAREAHIEAALERVRSRSLAMHKSEELVDVATVLYKELKNLDVRDFSEANIVIFDERKNQQTVWGARTESDYLEKSVFPLLGDQILQKFYDLWKRQETFYTVKVGGSELKKHSEFVYPIDDRTELEAKFIAGMPDPTFFHGACFSMGYLELVADKELSEGSSLILTRFAKVFDQSYTRFLDLQKAEAQAREAQIEAALERIRARSMAMYKSEELANVVSLMYAQIQNLGFTDWGCAIVLCDEEAQIMRYWYAELNMSHSPEFFTVPLTNKTIRKIWKLWKQGIPQFTIELLNKKKDEFTEYMLTETDHKNLPDEVKDGWRSVENVFFCYNNIKYGFLEFDDVVPFAEENLLVYQRFAKVFEQTYTRFLDLQKAEAQAREAQIEAGLERVRSRSMAMHKSEELSEVVTLVYEEIKPFGFATAGVELILMDEKNELQQYWLSTAPETKIIECFNIPTSIHPHFQKQWKAWKDQIPRLTLTLEGQEKKAFDQLIFTKTDFKNLSDDVKEFILNHGNVDVFSHAIMKYGLLEAVDRSPLSEEKFVILERFAKIFEQTYTRFLDLQKAEAQTREAQIETAMERVRSRTMAMHRSEEIADIAGKIFAELKQLDLVLNRVLIWIFNDSESYINWWSANPEIESNAESYRVNYNEHPVFLSYLHAWQQRKSLHLFTLSGDTKKTWEEHLFTSTELSKLPVAVRKGMREEGTIFTTSAMSDYGLMMVGSFEPLSEANIDIIQRFGRVFQQSYTRYLDVQKAEEQAREAQIELGLERVRARAMAMQKSDELAELVDTVFKELTKLHFTLDRCIITIVDERTMSARYWMANPEIDKTPISYHVPLDENSYMKAAFEAWKEGKTKWVYDLKGGEKTETVKYIFSKTELRFLPEEAKKGMAETKRIFLSSSFNNFGSLQTDTLEPLSEDNLDILYRFAKVFDLTYTRFNDLQKAEAQAREARIEAALERVRSRTMAMRRSDELADAATILFQQVKALGVPQWVCGFCIFEIDDKEFTWYPGSRDGDILTPCKVPLMEHPVFIQMNESRKRGDELYVYEIAGEIQAGNYRYMMTLPGMRESLQNILDAGLSLPEFQINHLANFSHGNLTFITYEPFPEMHDVFKRFAKVFEQTYTRFLDLQKAEAQARESQIEAALEKVRSRSLAMHTTNELGEVVKVIVEKLKDLGVVLDANGVVLCTYFQDSRNVLHWIVSPDYSMAGSYLLPYFDHPIFNAAWHSKENGDEYFSKAFSVEEKNSFFEYAFEHSDYKHFPEEFKQWVFQNDKHSLSFAWQKNSAILIPSHTGVLPTEADKAILIRFAKVFEQTYTRFLDLQKAEAQAREAHIETALEKVRSRSMGMQKSDELREVVAVLYEQMEPLGLAKYGCELILCNEQTDQMEFWHANPIQSVMPECYYVSRSVDPICEQEWKAWKEGTSGLIIELKGEKKHAFDNVLLTKTDFKKLPDDIKKWINAEDIIVLSFATMKFGFLEAVDIEALQETKLLVLNRFAKVFEQTYTRFNDLKQAEAQALEATKRASVDRIRAEIASMRTTTDLERITPLIWNELTTLGVPFIRCGVFIMDEAQQTVQSHLSTPDGKATAGFRLPYYATEQSTLIVTNWQQKKIFKYHMDEAAFAEYTKNLLQQGAVTSGEKYLTENRPTDLYLHFLPFLQGMLYVGNTEPLSDDALQLVQNLADAFSTAYARYEDFNKLELAKEQIEKTLVDLKQTQAQLVQSEKMASLGELTAGIAHEIQNPLNFVNNFSEVNEELLTEMKDEMIKGNTSDAFVLANEAIENQKKINLHGKRADAIVKGMLQHSRSSTGQKQLTDMETLCDEYLRLAYHGLRAKDKPFNATMKTDFDNSIGKIDIIPQDIGRVLLNLINNAFYAVDEKRKLQPDGYEPTVWVSTKKTGDKALVSVKDNGIGISPKVMDKIFQPFFTTKPTGQGTGLGLSLSYDIVKAHSGELKAESKEGEGSEFIIQLPCT